MRPGIAGVVPGLGTGMERVAVAVAVLLVATAIGVWLRRSGHRLGRGSADVPVETAVTLDERVLGAPLGERATLVQFSSAFCQPCRATRRILDQVSSQVEGVAHVEIDAEANLGLVRRLDIMRTPTVLVLDAQGRVVRRASGQPRPADVIAALGAVVDA